MTALDLFSLEGRVALVTGGNGGLGRAMALGLQRAGATVLVTGRNDEKNQAIAAELGGPEFVYELEVRDEAAVAATMAQIVAHWRRLDILVNNAGLTQRVSALELSQADWERVIGGNLTGTFLCAKHAARTMVAQGQGGKIINLGSMYSVFGAPNGVSYASSKTGVLGLTRALAVELGRHRIQVNAILPGWHATEMTQPVQNSPLGDLIRRKTPAGRWGTPADVVGLAIFLASAASDFVTGAAIPVDGGYAVADRLIYE
ncbi:MAG: SDR family oxidoreductase [Caldilineaceae bacterium]|nr:SDR family oxidoreductase [Caldilineaceae bacterium]